MTWRQHSLYKQTKTNKRIESLSSPEVDNVGDHPTDVYYLMYSFFSFHKTVYIHMCMYMYVFVCMFVYLCICTHTEMSMIMIDR